MAGLLTILVVDAFVPFRIALRKIVEQSAGLTIVGEAGDGYSAMETAFRLVPRIIVMDVMMMPRLNGVEATRRIKRVLPGVHIIGLASVDDTATRDAMKAAGCSAFMAKEMAHTLPDIIATLTGRPVDEVSRDQESRARIMPAGR